MARAYRGVMAYWSGLAASAGGTSEDRDGLLAWTGPHPTPEWINGIARSSHDRGEFATPDAFLGRVAEVFDPIGHGCSAVVRVGLDDDLDVPLQAAGFQLEAEVPVMIVDSPLGAERAPQGVSIEPVLSAADRAAFSRTVAVVYESTEPALVRDGLAARLFADPTSLVGPDRQAVVARWADGPSAGEAIGCGLVAVAGGLPGLYWIGTVERARGRGLGRAITRRLTDAGLALHDGPGAVVALEATALGLPLYLRLGYREIARYRLYARGTREVG